MARKIKCRKIKCKNCKTYFPKPDKEIDIIMALGVKFCSKSCRRSFISQKNKEKLEKLKLKKQKTKEKKQNTISYLKKRADKLWSECVKINYNHECQYCGKKEHLNSHHLFTRSRNATRFDLDNGICLCSGCHTLSSKFSAHQTGLEFFEWLEGIRGRDWINELSRKSRETIVVTPDFIKEQINILQQFKQKHENKLNK